jgi:hypothetical protein
MLRADLTALLAQSRVLSLRWKQDRSQSAAEAARLRADLTALKRRHTVALEREEARTLADPALRAAEALVAAGAAWERERVAGAHVAAVREDTERHAALRERDEAGRLARDYWATAERLLARGAASEVSTPGTAWPGAAGTP